MAKSSTKSRKTTRTNRKKRDYVALILGFRPRWVWVKRGLLGLVGLYAAMILIFAVIRPPTTPYILAEGLRRGGIERDWVALEDMAPALARSVVAAEDANFCDHWGFDMRAIRAALDEGAGRGASTLSQQTVKNVFLWHGRSWPRKALEAVFTPVVELVWTKRRILEVYLNVAEMGPGIFGAEAAARHYFGRSAADLSEAQAALIAAALPNPKERDPGHPTDYLRRRARSIADGAATIAADGRAACFED